MKEHSKGLKDNYLFSLVSDSTDISKYFKYKSLTSYTFFFKAKFYPSIVLKNHEIMIFNNVSNKN